ncbi:cobyric acid synthase [Acetobacter indonesiensis NRIC 0313]|uniref:Cobyric acid synthase n=2 Tax=Acetobacter indonesiensis TaxID=104101 RepID=A0A6N3T7N4_9PROT|nr:cobyric acid synthase CobQ [Acetobacter indonesiensis]GBQ57678.1 cobyric acid synthase [Acetobacter indonesiensis NRIC 0313]GEN03994.1 cobyric acid synthase [Acetobacter indonesiensis]
MSARVLMVQGTGSSVGKSTLVAGLARAYTRRGLRVLPFKPQNMSNNAAVTQDGGEIGRAQALQARACGVQPETDMNPVLLKPQGETGAQLIVQGRKLNTVAARAYQKEKNKLLPAVLESFYRLAERADLILVEGAGSASEVNLRANDIANMGFAQAVNAPVVLVGDIDRGGVIASLVGTQVVVAKEDAEKIKAFIVNKMRGDTTLFEDGMAFIADRTGWLPLGVVPDLPAVRQLPAEDAAELKTTFASNYFQKPDEKTITGISKCPNRLRVAVPILPLIANFDDLDPLRSEPGVELLPVMRGEPFPECDLVILPGSKGTLSDLACLRSEGWDKALVAHVQRGGHIMGLCGGYQMLGKSIADWAGIEGNAGESAGLDFLSVETILHNEKTLEEKKGFLANTSIPVHGYEMHIGETSGQDRKRPLLVLDNEPEGAISENGHIYGTYLHGVFTNRSARLALLQRAGGMDFAPDGFWSQREISGQKILVHSSYDVTIEKALDALADHLETHLDLDALLALAQKLLVYS